MKMPPDDALDTAIAWLRDNEGDGGESDRCKAVADWLNHEQIERALRDHAYKAGVPVASLRRKLAENASTQPPATAIVCGAWQENADYVLRASKTASYVSATVYFERNGRDQHPRFTPHLAEARLYKSRRGARAEILRLKQRYPDNQTIARLEEMPR